ncbi:hypothetical protein ES708_25730 [subsurface metagenome]
MKAKLKEIKECNLDIAILRRRLDEFSSQNYIERDNKKYTIEDLTSDIGILEKELEEELTASKGTKIDTQMGYVGFKDMPDEWIIDVPKVMDFFKTIPEKLANKFTRITTDLLKGELKKAIIADNAPIFEKSKITSLGAKLYLIDEDTKEYPVEGVGIKRQDRKFYYKIKSD